MDKKYNLLLPIAGKAQRFIDKGYVMPKPLIMARDEQIIDLALKSVNVNKFNLIFVVRLDHINNFAIDEILKQKFGNSIKIVVVDHITQGSVSTCLLAKEHIDNDMPLVIYTPDVCFEETESSVFDPDTLDKDIDGCLLTFKANSDAHSYVQIDENGYAIKTAEKEVISENAAVGVYYYKTGSMFVKYAEEMIEKNIRVKNEFYISPMYNLLIRDSKKITIKQVEKMHVLGTPEELEFFINYVYPKFGNKPIALCCDHSGFKAKETAKAILDSLRISYIDFGTYVNKSCDYNDYVTQAVDAINSKTCDFALGFCRTGQGVNILANHLKNTRAALIFDEYTAEHSVRHNCANFFSIPEKYVDNVMLEKIIKILLKSTFDGGRHMTRMKKTIG